MIENSPVEDEPPMPAHPAPHSGDVFLLRYLDDHFSNLEGRLVAKIDELKAAIDGLKQDVADAANRDTEDVGNWQARIAELQAQIAAGDQTLDALLPELNALRDQIKAHDLDPSFPAAAPSPTEPPPAP